MCFAELRTNSRASAAAVQCRPRSQAPDTYQHSPRAPDRCSRQGFCRGPMPVAVRISEGRAHCGRQSKVSKFFDLKSYTMQQSGSAEKNEWRSCPTQ